MIRSFAKDKFITILIERPATIKSMQKPDDKFLARCLNCNHKVVQYVDTSWLTITVLQELTPFIIESRYPRLYPHFDILSSFPQSVLDSLPEKNLRELCNAHEGMVKLFPSASYDLYLNYVKSDRRSDYKEIPEKYRTEEMLATLFSKYPALNTIPEESFTDRIVNQALEKEAYSINYIPAKFLTHDRLEKAFKNKRYPNLELLRDDIPFEVWDQGLADLATANGNNIKYIPEVYITKAICLNIVTKQATEIQSIPAKYIDEDVLLAAMTSGNLTLTLHHSSSIPKKFLKKPFLLKLAEKDAEKVVKQIADHPSAVRALYACYGIHNYLYFQSIEPEDWIKILKICPMALHYLPKEHQTDEIINTFFENASLNIIDRLYGYIHLGKIKKEHAPYLIGTTVPLLQDIISRKNIKKPKRDFSKKVKAIKVLVNQKDSVGVDLSDSEYLNITRKFGQ